MQNALAILQFPLAPVQPATSDTGPTTQDFELSFAAELPKLAENLSPVDPTAIALDQPVGWVFPILPMMGNLPVGLQDAPALDAAFGNPAAVLDGALPTIEQSLVSAPAIIPVPADVAVEVLSKAIDFEAEPSRTGLAPALPSEGSVVTDMPSLEPALVLDGAAEDSVASGNAAVEAEPRDMPRALVLSTETSSPDSVQVGKTGPLAEVWPPSKPAQSPQTEYGRHSDASATTMVRQVIDHAAMAGTTPTPTDPLTSEVPHGMSKATPPPVDALPVGTLLFATPQSPNAPPPDGADLVLGADVGTVLTQTPEAPKTTKLTGVEASVVHDPTLAPVVPLDAPIPETRAQTSFWERFFTNGSEMLPLSYIQQDPVTLVTTDRLPRAIGLVPVFVAGADSSEDVGLSRDNVSAPSEEGEGEKGDIPLTVPSPPTGPSPAPALRLEAAPILTVLPWYDGIDDQAERLDSAQSSFSSLPSASFPTASSGTVGPLGLPVQQVAAQLTGVLVQAFDRVTELALAPEELGKVRLRMEPDAANPDRLTITINVERPETLDLFRRHAGELAEAIRNAGYSGAHIDFGGQGHGSGSDQQQGRSGVGADLVSDEAAPTQYSPRKIAGTTLDLRL